MEPTTQVRAPSDSSIKITKWKVKKGYRVSHGSVLCIYESENGKNQKLKSNQVGTIVDILVNEGGEACAGCVLMHVQSCTHPTVMKDMCAECGANLRDEQGLAGKRNKPATASVAMVHSIPELIVSESEALEIGKADENRLLKTRKLVLLVDLDQTLIHTTNDNIPPNLKDVYHFQLYCHGSVLLWYHTRLRPSTQHFLEKISKLYELHICTFGVRMYAHTIAKFLDPDGKYFSHRILSRDECFNQSSKTANLKALFPCGDSMVCIIDDREDVWNFSPNLVHVKPYRFFQGTADINAPVGLAKTENDDQPITHRVRKVSRSNSTSDTESPDPKKSKQDSETQNSNNSNTEKDMGSESSDSQKPESQVDEKETPQVEDTQNNNSNKQEECDNTNNKMDILDDKDKTEEGEGNSVKQKNDTVEEQPKIQCDNPTEKSEKSENKSLSEDLEKSLEKEGEVTDNKNGNNSAKSSSQDDHSEDVKSDSAYSKSGEGTDNKQTKDESEGENKETTETTEVEIEWDDEDDYLLYLEEILTRIHKAFYDLYDQMKSKSEITEGTKPDLKNIIPYVKRKVLKGTNIVFSGVIPTNMVAEKSRAYIVAKALGANIQANFVPKTEGQDATTHMVAARLGTAKVRLAQKAKNVHIVNADWLWCCAERWEKANEKLFPLTKDTSPSRDSPVIVQRPKAEKRKSDDDDSNDGKRIKVNDDNQIDSESDVASGSSQGAPVKNGSSSSATSNRESRFSVSFNPLYSFSDDDIACMDKEVEELMDEDEDESDEDAEERDSRMRSVVLSSSSADDDNSSSEDSMTGDLPKGWKVKGHRSRSHGSNDSSSDRNEKDVESENELESFEKTVDAFAPDTESDGESIGSVDDELAEAVEKEFLAQI